jgi:hypothetical protein
VLQDPIAGVGFIRELESDAAARVADDPHTYVGVEAPGRRVGSGQDLYRPVGERQHAASLGGPATQVLRVGLDHSPRPPRVVARGDRWVSDVVAPRGSLGAWPRDPASRSTASGRGLGPPVIPDDPRELEGQSCVKHVLPSISCNLHGSLGSFVVTCQLVLRGFEG